MLKYFPPKIHLEIKQINQKRIQIGSVQHQKIYDILVYGKTLVNFRLSCLLTIDMLLLTFTHWLKPSDDSLLSPDFRFVLSSDCYLHISDCFLLTCTYWLFTLGFYLQMSDSLLLISSFYFPLVLFYFYLLLVKREREISWKILKATLKVYLKIKHMQKLIFQDNIFYMLSQ